MRISFLLLSKANMRLLVPQPFTGFGRIHLVGFIVR